MKQMRNIGKKVQVEDAEPPYLESGLDIYMQAFHMLDRGRAHLMGPTPIPWSEVELYARANNFDERQTDWLHYFIIKLDEYELERVRKEQKRQAEKKPKK